MQREAVDQMVPRRWEKGMRILDACSRNRGRSGLNTGPMPLRKHRHADVDCGCAGSNQVSMSLHRAQHCELKATANRDTPELQRDVQHTNETRTIVVYKKPGCSGLKTGTGGKLDFEEIRR